MTGTAEERVALALAALGEVTDPADVGTLLDAERVEPGVVDLHFACNLPGYAAWHWTVSTTDLPDSAPTVLEVELLPGDDALLAPAWVPWTERLAEWRRQHPDEAAPEGLLVDDIDLDEVEDDEDEEHDLVDDDDVVDEQDLAIDDDDDLAADEAFDDGLEASLDETGSDAAAPDEDVQHRG